MGIIDTVTLDRQFARIGAKIEVGVTTNNIRFFNRQSGPSYTEGYQLNIRQERQAEVFTLAVNEAATNEIDFTVINVRPEKRHLLLLVKRDPAQTVPATTASLAAANIIVTKSKFLCGFDERHWFAAELKSESVTDVVTAMEALKPTEARVSQQRHAVRSQDWHKRHNAGFMRQGEWFFIPQPNFKPDPNAILYANEPIRRGNGKAHMVEQLYRTGGDIVWVNGQRVLTKAQYEKEIARNAKFKPRHWRQMRRGMTVYVRGAIRHPDHATIVLPCWHQVVMNTETISTNLAFLD